MVRSKVTEKLPISQEIVEFDEDPIDEAIRAEVRERIEEVLEEEVTAALGAASYERIQERRGFRNGYQKKRILHTSLGMTRFDKPRARITNENGEEEELELKALRRYKRRSGRIDAAIVNSYLSGTNTRRMELALGTLLRGTPLSRSTVSRLNKKLKAHFEAWRTRSLEGMTFAYIYVDAINIKVRVLGRVVKMPVLATVGVKDTGEKVLLALAQMGSESEEAWKTVLLNVVKRGLNRPAAVICDGSPGLRAAIEAVWPGIKVQRCVVHKLRNLLSHAPEHVHEEIKADYNKIVYAKSLEEAREAYAAFEKKWDKECPSVADSLREAGSELLTFFEFPKAHWKSLRTTNIIERVNGEFRRRVKTQGSLPTQESATLLLFGLYATGQIRMNRFAGAEEIPAVMNRSKEKSEMELTSKV